MNTLANIEPQISSEERIQSSVLSLLLYFDLFQYPLNLFEISQCNSMNGIPDAELKGALDKLVYEKVIFFQHDFYSIQNNPSLITRRQEGNKRALTYFSRAQKVSRFIACFPYVRGVMLTGSLSKGYMDKESDVDYFIITEKGRLWLCRTLLASFRKLMIGPLKKYFCINYFIDTSTLSIPDRNLFTATEIAFILPTYNYSLYQDMIHTNEWYRKYYPNKALAIDHTVGRKSKFWVKRITEKLCNGRVGDQLESFLYKVMLKRWKKRYKEFNETEFDLNIRTKKNVSKQHEKGHQFLILEKYHKHLLAFEAQHKMHLQHG